MLLSLNTAAREFNIAKATLSKAIRAGRVSATLREDKSWGIDPAEMARFLEVRGHRMHSREPGREAAPDPAALELRHRAELAEREVAVVREMLEQLRAQRDDLARQRAAWEQQAQLLARIAPPASSPAPRPSWWRRLVGPAVGTIVPVNPPT